MKKYEFTGERLMEKIPVGVEARMEVEVFRIRALIDIPEHSVKTGDLGGWIEKEENLSHEGTCWIGNGVVCGESTVKGDVSVGDIEYEETHCIIRGNSHIEGTGKLGNVVIDNSILKGNVSSFSTAFDMSYVEGEVTLNNGLLDKCYVRTDGGSISFLDCVLQPKLGRLMITNHPGENLRLDTVQIEFSPGTGDQKIHAFGELESVFGKGMIKLEINGHVDIKCAYLDDKTSLLVSPESKKVKVKGKSPQQPVHFTNGKAELVDTTLEGNVTIGGNVKISESTISDFANIENQSEKMLSLHRISMSDCSKLQRTETCDKDLEDVCLVEEEQVVLA